MQAQGRDRLVLRELQRQGSARRCVLRHQLLHRLVEIDNQPDGLSGGLVPRVVFRPVRRQRHDGGAARLGPRRRGGYGITRLLGAVPEQDHHRRHFSAGHSSTQLFFTCLPLSEEALNMLTHIRPLNEVCKAQHTMLIRVGGLRVPSLVSILLART